MAQTIAELSGMLSIDGHVAVTAGSNGSPHVLLRNRWATVDVALAGAQVLRCDPYDAAPLLFVSARALEAAGKAQRGGVPVCWPWFGPRAAAAQHGFARNVVWQAVNSDQQGDTVSLTLALPADAGAAFGWQYAYAVTLTVRLSDVLVIELSVTNRDRLPWQWSGALHTYLAVSDIAQTRIVGLDGCAYRDQVLGGEHVQHGDLLIDREIDRVYHDRSASLQVVDGAGGRVIDVAKWGSGSTVVWNPWVERSAAFADLAPDEYRRFVCVETANTDAAAVTLAAGERTVIGLRLRLID
jgi:glucose-6-phosphate 1-epimerase